MQGVLPDLTEQFHVQHSSLSPLYGQLEEAHRILSLRIKDRDRRKIIHMTDCSPDSFCSFRMNCSKEQSWPSLCLMQNGTAGRSHGRSYRPITFHISVCTPRKSLISFLSLSVVPESMQENLQRHESIYSSLSLRNDKEAVGHTHESI